jgi:hypothetical protein
MAIENIYREVLIDNFVRNKLNQGEVISALETEEKLNDIIDTTDLSQPQFLAENFHVSPKVSSSATDFKNTFLAMQQDLRILYKEMIRLSKVSGSAFERWRLEASNIEKKLIDLEDRIENLLLLTQDTEGYHSILVDNFTDTNFIDLDLSSILPNLDTETIEMSPSTIGETRIFLNDLDFIKDLSFKVRTTIDFLSREDAAGTNLSDSFKQTSAAWWTNILMKSQKPVTCELTVRITAEEPIDISKIVIDLHHSGESSPINITPLYSIDNQTFAQLPSVTFTQEVRTNAVFAFPTVKAKWIKLLLTKVGPDPSSSVKFFSYQFGFKSIAFYSEGFDVQDTQQLITTPLSVVDENGIVEFEKLVLEVCERVENNTEIDYFITTSNDSNVPIDSNTLWSSISPVNRITRESSAILNIGDSLEVTIGDIENVTISYDGRASLNKYVNPSRNFFLLSRNSITGTVDKTEIDNAKTSTVPRYAFTNSNDRILNYQIQHASLDADTNLNINENNIIIFRNIGTKGSVSTDITNKVRGIQRGWKFEDPYYSCVIEILNSQGLEIDVGDQPIIIDDIEYRNKIDNTTLTGKTGITTGVHKIKVHKNNWVEVEPNKDSLAALQIADPLYPFNHKLLIEGYVYDNAYPSTEEKIYTGVDLFAEMLMTKVSVFDMINNVAKDRYDLYALDKDTPNSHVPSLSNQPTKVFLVKVDENNPDFQNEQFVIRFKQINALRKYLRLRADLTTEDETVSPTLHSYKIKLG